MATSSEELMNHAAEMKQLIAFFNTAEKEKKSSFKTTVKAPEKKLQKAPVSTIKSVKSGVSAIKKAVTPVANKVITTKKTPTVKPTGTKPGGFNLKMDDDGYENF